MENINIKDIIKNEYVKCATNPVHFFKKYCYISHPIQGKILFNLYPFQENVFDELKNNRFNIINKSRQLGLSTLVAGYSLWIMLFNPNKNIFCVATKQDTAKNMVEKVQFMYDNLPKWLKGNKKPLESNKLSLRLANNSCIKAGSAASDVGRSEAVSLLILDEAAFIEDIQRIYTSIKPTISTGGSCIALSSPNGVGNWFHKTCIDAQMGKGDFKYTELKWNLHPDRDSIWEATERENMSAREFAQEYDCDFLGSGLSVVPPEILNFYQENYIIDPIEKRYMGGDYWVWQYPDLSKSYIISADVARGDSSDYSSFHVIDLENCEQVAEFNSQLGTREYSNILLSAAIEYNNALLIVENSNIGWDVINTIIEKQYPNLYYSPRSYGDMSLEKYISKLESEQTVPGFTMSVKTRPLVISKMESYIREKAFIFHSKRLLEQLRVFIWHNGKAQAQNGYNDDIVISAGIGLFIRDTAAKFVIQNNELNIASINNISKSSIYTTKDNIVNPYEISLNGHKEDIRWILG